MEQERTRKLSRRERNEDDSRTEVVNACVRKDERYATCSQLEKVENEWRTFRNEVNALLQNRGLLPGGGFQRSNGYDNILMFMRHYCLLELQKPLRMAPTICKGQFGKLIRRGVISVSTDCDSTSWNMFMHYIEDMYKGCSSCPVLLYPRVVGRAARPSQFKTRTALLKDMDCLLDILGITTAEDKSRFGGRSHQKDGEAYGRLLGGLQYNCGETHSPVNMFIGHSCAKTFHAQLPNLD